MPGTKMTTYDSSRDSIASGGAEKRLNRGRNIITTHSAMKLIIEEESARDPKVKEKMDFVKTQYEFKDDIPK